MKTPGFMRAPAPARAILPIAAMAVLCPACGQPGPPLPPEPRGPFPPLAVTARQLGEQVLVGFQVPKARGPKPAQQPVRAELVRVSYAPELQAPPDPDTFRRRGELVGFVDAYPLEQGVRLRVPDGTLGPGEPALTGWTLRYGIRVLDQRGRPSPLVVAGDLVPVEPLPPPVDLDGQATADGIRVTWSPPPGDERRYNLYRVAAGGEFGEQPLNPSALTSPEYLDTEIETGRTYRYQVRTTAAGELPYRESMPSAGLTVLAEDRFAPAAPDGLVAVQEGKAVRLFWNPNAERDLAGYRVYRRLDDGAWERIGPDPVDEPLYLDEQGQTGDRLGYYVTGVDRAEPPNESPPSEAVDLELAEEPASPPGGTP